ncbi:MAG: hypothetical protein M3Q70_02555 [bacterium]|nr:hypothetical protein [bacterium]
MRNQAELLQGTNIPTDELASVVFTPEQQEFLAVAEGFAYNEWSRVCDVVGLVAAKDEVPVNYNESLQRAGKWELDYPTKQELQR